MAKKLLGDNIRFGGSICEEVSLVGNRDSICFGISLRHMVALGKGWRSSEGQSYCGCCNLNARRSLCDREPGTSVPTRGASCESWSCIKSGSEGRRFCKSRANTRNPGYYLDRCSSGPSEGKCRSGTNEC